MHASKRPYLRASLIALTQTELMFVFSSLIILILLGSLDRIDELEGEREQVVQQLAAGPDDDLAEQTGALVDENAALAQRLELIEQSGEGDRARLVRVMERMLAQLELELDQDEPLADQLERAAERMAALEAELLAAARELAAAEGTPGPGGAVGLAQRVRALAAANRSLQTEVDAFAALADQAGISGTDLSELREAFAGQQRAAQQQVASLEQQLQAYREDLVGFLPCWPRQPNGHYFALDISWQSGPDLFRLAPAWPAGVPAIRSALAGPMAVLRSSPPGWIAREQLIAYSKRVEAARSAHYANDCLLTAKVPVEMAGKEIKFVRSVLGLYPVFK